MTPATLAEHDELDRSLTNQPPRGPEIIERFETMRIPAKEFGHTILDVCPDCPERTLALWKLQEAVMWATKAIAIHQDQIPETDR